ncbi:hypothetical protein JTE90_024074 [Oedothorax gibbosus]|uniref:Uncharacterized protein n=1 Tax=Oedothorax gibbosus TaxID=931172 RepID=A0AAV6U7I8_9ARAC|nr:hypothetical protein JTE90_024074 [Oedothorax gibbosus]
MVRAERACCCYGYWVFSPEMVLVRAEWQSGRDTPCQGKYLVFESEIAIGECDEKVVFFYKSMWYVSLCLFQELFF